MMLRISSILVVCLVMTGVWAQNVPVIKSAEMEADANNDGIPDDWGRYISQGTARTVVDREVMKSGQGSVRIEIDDDSRCTVSQLLAVPEAGTYTFGGWLKTELTPPARAYLYVQWRKGKGEIVKNEPPSALITGQTDWTEVALLATKPEEAESALLVIVVEVGKGKGGHAWADGMWLKAGVQIPNLLRNGGFEEDGDADQQPDAWSRFMHGTGFEHARDAEVARSGQASARLIGREGASDRAGFSQVSAAFAPSKGLRLTLWYKGSGTADGLLRVRTAPGVQYAGDDYGTTFFKLPTPREEWTEYVHEMGMPVAAQGAPAVRLEVILYQRATGTVWYDDVKLEFISDYKAKVEPATNALICPTRPEMGRVVLQNPPDFSWTPQRGTAKYTFQLSPDEAFPADKTFSVDTPYNVYSHSQVLAEGQWWWRANFTDAAGVASEWLGPRSFHITARAQPFTVPPVAELLARVPQDHPRIYATRATLEAFRAPLATTQKDWWATFRQRVDAAAQKPVDKEPPGDWLMGARPGGGPLTDEDIQRGNKLRSYAGSANTRMQELGFAYLLTGDRKYAEPAIAQMLEMATWDPLGVTSYKNQDQVFRDIAWMMATTYDWCWEVMTAAQRQTVREAIIARARTLYKHFAESSRPIYEYPYDSHGITAYGYLGICALALTGESAEADEWLRFVAATYPTVFPPWGGEEGGWGQGVAYWKWSQPFAWVFFDALKSATGVDMHQKAYCRNSSWYKLYMHPPWCDRHHFGDGNHGPPDSTDQSNMARAAREYNNPYFQWYAKNLPHNLGYGLYGYLWHDASLPVRPPADLPQGRYFPDIGWVAMHSDLSDPDDVMLMFKSSPFGSFNHSHADQNSFVVYGYGEPLLIDSGYYDWYGSPHDMGFTRQTKAHNSVLVNGEGQPIMDKTATGSIEQHFTSRGVDYAVGEAAPAYQGKLSKFERHILYVRPDAFLILDLLEAPAPSTFTWCVHSEQEMQLKPEQGEIIVTRGDARCLVKFLTPGGLKFEQTDQFTPPSTRKLANEWHTYVTTSEKTQRQVFLTFVRPYPLSEPASELKFASESRGGVTTVRWGQGELDHLVTLRTGLQEGRSDVPVLVMAPGGAGRSQMAAFNLKTLEVGGRNGERKVMQASAPVNAWFGLKDDGGQSASVAEARVQAREPVQVTFLAARDVRQVTLNGRALAAADYQLDAPTGALTLQLPVGDHDLVINPVAVAQAAPPRVEVLLGDRTLPAQVETLRTPAGGLLSWGSVQTGAGAYLLESFNAPAGSRLVVDRAPRRAGDMLYLADRSSLEVRTPAPAEQIAVRLQPLLKNAEPLVAQAAPEGELPAGAIKIEAESFGESGGGAPSRYTTRPFLSGGVGLGNWTLPGLWVRWEIKAPQAGKYRLVLKGATHEPWADRLLQLDGRPVGGEYRLHRFGNSGGYGASPDQWRFYTPVGADGRPLVLELTGERQALTMTCLHSLLNLDYLLLVPEG